MNAPTLCSYCKECPMKFLTFDCGHNFCVECLQEIYKSCYEENNPLCLVCLLCGNQTYVETDVIEVIKEKIKSSNLNSSPQGFSFISSNSKKNSDPKKRSINSISMDFSKKKRTKEKQEYIKCSEILKSYSSNDGSSLRNEKVKKEILQEISNIFGKRNCSQKKIQKQKCTNTHKSDIEIWCKDCSKYKCNFCFKECLDCDHDLSEINNKTESFGKSKKILEESEGAIKQLTEAKHVCKANIEIIEETYAKAENEMQTKFEEIQRQVALKFEDLQEEARKTKQIILENYQSDYSQILSLKKTFEENIEILTRNDNSYTQDERNDKLYLLEEILKHQKESKFDEYIREAKNFTCTTNTNSLFTHIAALNNVQFEISSLTGIEQKAKIRKSYLSTEPSNRLHKSIDFTFRTKLSSRRNESFQTSNGKKSRRSVTRSFIQDISKRTSTESALEEFSNSLKERSKLISDRFSNISHSRQSRSNSQARKGISNLIENLKRQRESFRNKSKYEKLSTKENNQFLI